MRFVYVDESTFAEPKACVGIGMLIADGEIPNSLISSAMEALRDDPDRYKEQEKKLDDETLSRGYFHASEDSGSSHSHLLRAINNSVDGEFVCDFHDATKALTLSSNSEYLRLSFAHNTLAAIQKKDKIAFFVEERGSLKASDLQIAHAELEKYLVQSAYDLPFLPTYFPEVSFTIVDKSNAGVQCCDLLLWAVNRKVNGEEKWYRRIESRIRSSFKDASDSWGGDNIPLGKGLTESLPHYGPDDFPRDPDTKISNELLVTFLLNAMSVCEFYSENPCPEVVHFQYEIDLAKNLKYDDSRRDYLDLLFTTYLKLFDMVDLVQANMSRKEKEFLLMSKKYSSLPLRRDFLHGVTTRQWLMRVRRDILTNHKELLEFSAKLTDPRDIPKLFK